MLQGGLQFHLNQQKELVTLLPTRARMPSRVECWESTVNQSNLELSFRSGEVRVDLRRRTLAIGGPLAKLGGRAFDVLHALIERSERVVPKQELLDLVWPGLVVGENTLQVHVVALRKLLGADAIATVSGRGYRFTLAADRVGDTPDRSPRDATTRAPQAYVAPTSLIGRDALVEVVCTRLRDPNVRLVSLTGAGGSGKTRVGLRVTAQMASNFSNGAFTVMLAPVRDPGLVASAIAAVMNVQEVGNQPLAELLVGHLREREVLLALDNFEHVLAATPLVATLLSSCPRLKVLTTTRALLKLPAEHEVAVPPLALPSRHAAASDIPCAPAVQLLRERALAAGHSVGDGPGELTILAEVCRTLDGLPLALELAAARLRMLSPQALLKRLGARMRLLERGADDDVAPRQRTLRATIDWSHDLLSVPERRLFRRLAVFVGGWDLDAAEAVTDLGDLSDSVLNLLTALVDQSLAQRTEDVDGEPRFAMLETVREYAEEKLASSGESATVRQRHAEHFVALAERAEPALTSAQRKPWMLRLLADYQNLRAALSWLVQERADGDAGLRLAASLPWLWYFAGQYNEGRTWLRSALAIAGAEGHVVSRARALSGAARLASFVNEMPEACALADESVRLWRGIGDRRGLGFALYHLGVPAMFTRGREQAVAAMEESLICFRELGDPWGVALAMTYKGVVLAFAPGAEREAQPALAEGRARFVALGDDWGASTTPGYLAGFAMRAGNFDLAREIAEEVVELVVELGDTYRISRGRHQLAEISLAQGRLLEASQHLRASLTINREQNRRGDAVQQLRLMGRLECLQGRYARAVRLFAAGLRADAPKAALPPDDSKATQLALQTAREALGGRHFEAEWALGCVASIEQAVDWALSGPGPTAAPS